MASTIIVTGDKLRKRKKRLKITKIVLLILLFLLISIFLILSIVYKGGRFTVTLDPNFSLKSGIVIYETLEDKRSQRKLYASELEFMDNISVEWIPKNIASEAEGSHNGKNYIAYTFYIENQGTETLDYWYQIVIDDVIKNVDDAVRIMIYRNDEKTIYAKKNEDLNAPEGIEEVVKESINEEKTQDNLALKDNKESNNKVNISIIVISIIVIVGSVLFYRKIYLKNKL